MLGLGVNKLWTSGGHKDGYAVLSQKAPLVAAFDDEYYRSNGSQTTFSNLITHARSSNATMTDSDGLIKWAPHNLLTYSEEFDNGAWFDLIAGTGVTPVRTANAGVAPDGTLTADRVYFERTIADVNNYSLIRQNISTVNGTGHLWVKSYDGTEQKIDFRVGGVEKTFTVTAEWQKITDSESSASQFQIGIRNSSAGLTSDVLLWGAHLYRSDLGGMVNNPDRGDSYVPTTSSAVYLPRRGHHVYNGYQWVNEGVLAESEARTNLITYSNDFSDASWTKTAVGLSSDSTTAPDGSVAVKMFETAFAGSHDLRVTSSTASASRISVYVKQGERRYCKFYSTGQVGVYFFDLQEGTIQTSWTTGTGATITPEGNGWHRISVPVPNAVSGNIIFLIGTAIDSTGNHTGDGSSGIYIYGAQVELTSGQASSYIPTNGSTVTRAAETFTVPYANLPWPTPQYIGDELVTNGTLDGASGTTPPTNWASDGITLFSDVSGALRIDRNNGDGKITQNITTEVGKIYFVSMYVVDTPVQDARVGITGITAVDSSSSAETITVAFIATATTHEVFVQAANSVSADITVDNISVREINPLSVSIQMDGRMTYADEDENIQHISYQWQADSNNEITGYLSTISTRTGKVVFRQIDNAIIDVSVTSDNYYSPDILVPYNIAGRHGSTFVNGAVNGVALTANTTPTALPDLSSTDLNLAYDYMGTIKTFRIWDKDIGDTGIAEATAPSLEPSLSLSFDSTESSFIDLGWD